MRRVLERIISAPVDAFHWWLDYVYVAYHQTKGVVLRTDFERYQNGDSTKPQIILLPGVYETWRFMQPLADALDKAGYQLHIVEEIGYNNASVERAAEYVQRYVKVNVLNNIVIVAHSKGGLVGKFLLMKDKERRIKGMVTVASPFSGSVYARFFLMKTVRIFSPNSPIVRLLATDRKVNKKIVSIYGRFDPHIPKGSFLDGAINVELPVRGHFKVLANKQVQRAVLEGVEQITREKN